MPSNSKKIEAKAEKNEPLIHQYHAVGPAAINAALQCKATKPIIIKNSVPYTPKVN